jgi:hypothetical protein
MSAVELDMRLSQLHLYRTWILPVSLFLFAVLISLWGSSTGGLSEPQDTSPLAEDRYEAGPCKH